MIIHFKRTTPQQFKLMQGMLEDMEDAITASWNDAQGDADCTDQIDADLDNSYAAIGNFVRDLHYGAIPT
jgi:hypothetical protein